MNNESHMPPSEETRQDALDVNDFVYAATGSRVRRVTLPNGEHWFPASDVCHELGYTTTRKALLDHVPEDHREFLETVTGSHSLAIPPGREWRRDTQMVNLQGLIMLVNGCTKRSCLPFKQWVSEVISTVQRHGSYSLERAEVVPVTSPADPPRTVAVPPNEIVEALTRLEVHNELFRTELLDTLHRSEQTWNRIADALENRRTAESAPGKRELRVRTERIFDQWKSRLSITEDVWAVALHILPVLAETGWVSLSPETLATRTGLTQQRAHACLHFLLQHRCLRQNGSGPGGEPIYVAELPPR